MAKDLVRPPLFTQFNRRAIEIAVVLFELAFEASQQRECISGRSRKAGENLVVVKAPYFSRARLHHSFTHRHLAIAGHRHLAIAANQKNGRAPYDWRFFLAHEWNETIGTCTKNSQATD